MQNREYLAAAARAVAEQLLDNPPILGITVDPEVAQFMGAFEEDALALASVIEDGLLTVNLEGGASYDHR